MPPRIVAKTVKFSVDLFLLVFCLLGKVLFAVVRFFLPPKKILDPQRILILDFDGSKIGDQVLGSAVITALKKKFPKAKIFVMCSFITEPIFANNKLVDKTISGKFVDFKAFLNLARFLELRKLKPDVAVSMSVNLSSHALAFLSGAQTTMGWDKRFKGFPLTNPVKYYSETADPKHEVFKHLELLKPLNINEKNPSVTVTASALAREYARAILPKSRVLVAVHGGSKNFPIKNWPAQNFSRVIEELASKEIQFCLIGSLAEKEIANQIFEGIRPGKRKFVLNLAGKTSLDQLIAVLENSQIFFGIDSAPMHLAAAAGCFVYAVFGPKPPIWFSPFTEKKHVFYKGDGKIIEDYQKIGFVSPRKVIVELKKDALLSKFT
ncbi:MAG: glycosyltransferase family 9 protein, partial [archaeon]|nr:glycosyltransferase family 9 protein [archaeon]